MKQTPNKVFYNLVFVNDEKMKRLNKTYRNIDKASNVITFSLDNEKGSVLCLGEVVINWEEAFREAKRLGLSRREEILRLANHGLRNLLNESQLRKQLAS